MSKQKKLQSGLLLLGLGIGIAVLQHIIADALGRMDTSTAFIMVLGTIVSDILMVVGFFRMVSGLFTKEKP